MFHVTSSSRVVAAAFLLCGCFEAADGMQGGDGGPAAGKERTRMIAQLEDQSERVRKAAASEILNSRDADIERIAAIVERSVPHEAKKAIARDSIVLLGKLRAAKAVPLLVRF